MIKNSSQFELHSDTLERKRKGERGSKERRREERKRKVHDKSPYL